MLANEMRDSFVLQYEKINANNAPGLQDNEISIFLTKAQQEIAYKIIRKITNPVKEGLEETELRKQGLANLIEDSDDPTSSGTTLLPASPANFANGRFWQLPDSFWFTITDSAFINVPDCTTGDPNLEAFVKVVTHNELKNNKYNPYRAPILEGDQCFVWRLEYQRENTGYDMLTSTTQDISPPKHELITQNNFTVVIYKIRYIRYPKPIIIDKVTPINQKNSELNQMLHEAIVEEAVRLASVALREQPVQNQQLIANLV